MALAQTVTTSDALYTQVKQAQQILAGGGHYLMVGKGNQSSSIKPLNWPLPPSGDFSVTPPPTKHMVGWSDAPSRTPRRSMTIWSGRAWAGLASYLSTH
jgi:hypothetical protein